MSTIQAIDDRNEPIPVFGYVYNACQKLIANTSSANISSAFGSSATTCNGTVLCTRSSSSLALRNHWKEY